MDQPRDPRSSRRTLTLGVGTLTLADLRDIYHGEVDGALDEAALPAIAASRTLVQRIADGDEAVYGINTGFGKLAQTKIPHDRLAELQRNLVQSHSAGIGAPLPTGVVRLVLVTKAHALARGFSGVNVETVRALIALANAGVLPRIPCK
ncbi:MAG TPA: aromatic amino acid lyase, partial [Casimicrobiaceae bacterium]